MAWYIVAWAAALALSAVFSGAETAIFSLSPAARDELGRRHPAAARRLDALGADPPRLLGTILLGNLIVNTTGSALATLLALRLARAAGGGATALYLGAGGLVATAAVIVFGEVLPKLAASRNPAGFARLASPLVAAARIPLGPFVRLIIRASARLAPRGREPESFSDDELRTMVELGRARGVIAPGEEEILSNLIGLEERTVAEVMTPRIDIVALADTTTVRDALARCREAGFSRLPVYHGDIDHVVGTAYAKELIAADPAAPVCSLCRPAFFVPEVKRLLELLDELRRKGSHIAVVVDEFGQTAGLVTLEDLLEAVFGEITDEYDVAEELPYRQRDDGSYLVDGEIDVATLDRLFRGAFRDVEHERLAGFIHDRLGRLPREGDTIRHGRVEIRVEQTDGLKLEKVLVSRRHK